MIELERKTKTLLISTVLVLTILCGIAVGAYAYGGTYGTNTSTSVMYDYGSQWNGPCTPCGRNAHGWGRGEFIAVSQEYKDNVINITQSDPDVQELLADGYNITEVRPIINAEVEADGTVVMKATKAVVLLEKDTNHASVLVDLQQGKVTGIVIMTRTVIEKP